MAWYMLLFIIFYYYLVAIKGFMSNDTYQNMVNIVQIKIEYIIRYSNYLVVVFFVYKILLRKDEERGGET